MNRFDEKAIIAIESTIKAHGRAVYTNGPDQYGNPAVAYSVGMERIGLPEIFIFGLAPEDAATVVNLAAESAVRGRSEGREILKHGSALIGILTDRPIGVIKIDEDQARKHMKFANMLAAKDVLPVPAVQLVVPDTKKLWPWQYGHEYGFPILGEVPATLS